MTGPDVDLRRDSIPALVRQLAVAPVAVVDELVARLWRIGPAAIATVLIVGATIKEVLPPGPPVLSADAALYQHGGWYMNVGGVPYVDIFDVKPPVAFELPAILALLTGGDPTLLYAASVLTTGAAAVAVVALVGTLVYNLTDDPWAALCAEVAVLAFPVLFWYPAKGFRPKLFVLAFGLGSLVLARRDRTASAGTLAALAAGMWQLGAFFPLVVCGLVWRRSGALGRVVAAMAGTTIVVIAPIVLQGGTTAMLVEAVLIPLTDAEGQSPSFAAIKSVFLLGFAAPVVLVGAAAAVLAVHSRRDAWWVSAGAIWFTIQVYLDLDWYPDLFALTVFAALGLGLAVAKPWPSVSIATRPGVVAVVALVVVLNATLLLGVGPAAGFSPSEASQSAAGSAFVSYTPPGPVPPEYGPFYDVSQGQYMNDLYWNQQIPPYCHYRFAGSETRWLERTDRTYRTPCGLPP